MAAPEAKICIRMIKIHRYICTPGENMKAGYRVRFFFEGQIFADPLAFLDDIYPQVTLCRAYAQPKTDPRRTPPG